MNPVSLQIGVDPEAVVTGDRKTATWNAIPGSGSRETATWVVRGSSGQQVEITAISGVRSAAPATSSREAWRTRPVASASGPTM